MREIKLVQDIFSPALRNNYSISAVPAHNYTFLWVDACGFSIVAANRRLILFGSVVQWVKT